MGVTSEQEQLGSLMGTISRGWRMRINERLSTFGLTHAKWTLLRRLFFSEEGVRQGELARELAVEAPTLVRLIDDLEADGWLTRRPDKGDRRVNWIVPIPEAQPRFENAQRAVRELRAEIFADFSPEDLRELLQGLQRLKQGLYRDGDAPI